MAHSESVAAPSIIDAVHIKNLWGKKFLCIYSAQNCSNALLSVVLCTIKNPHSHSIRVGHSLHFVLPSVSCLCRKPHKAILIH